MYEILDVDPDPFIYIRTRISTLILRFTESQNDQLHQALKTFISENLVISVLQYIVRFIDEATATASVQRTITVFTEFIALVDKLNPRLFFRCQELTNLATTCSNIVTSQKVRIIPFCFLCRNKLCLLFRFQNNSFDRKVFGALSKYVRRKNRVN